MEALDFLNLPAAVGELERRFVPLYEDLTLPLLLVFPCLLKFKLCLLVKLCLMDVSRGRSLILADLSPQEIWEW